MKRTILFIGYELTLRDEIRDFLKGRGGEPFFTDTAEETIRVMQTGKVSTVVLNMQRLEDAAMLRYINIHYQNTHVLVMPDQQLQDVIPALASGHYDLLKGPITLEELEKII